MKSETPQDLLPQVITRRGLLRGLGLSLAAVPLGKLLIVHNVVALHGWTLALAPSDYGGLEVGFTGPLMTPPD